MKVEHISIVLFTIIAFMLSNCGSDHTSVQEIEKESSAVEDDERAITLLTSKCYVCHKNNVAHDQMLAPPMIAVKEHYLSASQNETDFTNQFISFLEAPSREKAIMKNAVNKFGLMPNQGTKKEDLEKIARYLYHNSIDQPDWWNLHKDSVHLNESTERGMHYALSTKKALGKKLMNALEEGGPSYAVKFCNTQALRITDSLSQQFNATIKRVSDKPRSISNMANEEELSIIGLYKKALRSNQELKPITHETPNGTQFYYPITTNGMCLKCHGEPEKDINEETMNQLNQLYPSDKATGYQENEIRGIWSIIFKN